MQSQIRPPLLASRPADGWVDWAAPTSKQQSTSRRPRSPVPEAACAFGQGSRYCSAHGQRRSSFPAPLPANSASTGDTALSSTPATTLSLLPLKGKGKGLKLWDQGPRLNSVSLASHTLLDTQ